MPALPNWIPVREDIHEDPAILRIADKLSLRPEEVVGYCIRFWSWVSRNCNDGRVTGVSLDRLEQVLSQPGFLYLLCEVGWLEYENSGPVPIIVIPNFDRWLSQGAKTRLLTARRVQANRAKSCNDPSVTNALPQKQKQKQKQKQEDNPPIVPPRGRQPLLMELPVFVQKYNERARQVGIATIRKVESKRRKLLLERLTEPGWLEDLKEAFSRLPLPGGDDAWQPDIDWFIRAADQPNKILEGKFEFRKTLAGGNGAPVKRREDKTIEDYK